MKIELGISQNYVGHWTVDEALREIHQNAIDSGVDYYTSYNDDEQELRIVNQSIITRDTLVLGESSKRDDNSKIGKFGEGYKLAILVLLRNCHRVEIYTGDERWLFMFEQSANFNATVLTVEIEKLEDDYNETVFVIGNIDIDTYNEYIEHNLHLQEQYNFIQAKTCEVLIDKRHQGKIFIGGLYICDHPGTTQHGFNFQPGVFPLGRDRKVIRGFDANYYSSKALVEACRVEQSMSLTILNNLESDGSTEYLSSFVSADDELVQAAWRRFEAEYPGYIPICYNNDLTKYYVGVKPISVSSRMFELLEKSNGYKTALAELERRPEPDTPEVTLRKFYDEWNDLFTTECKQEFANMMLTSDSWINK